MLNSARTGRRPGESGSREAILRTARTLFAGKGYDGTSVRAVAARAGVDPGLVMHFFGSKAELFAHSLELPFDPAELEEVLSGDRSTLGRRIATFYLKRVFHDRAQTVLSLLRSSVTNAEAAAMLRRAVEASAIALLRRHLPGRDAALRGELVASHMMGVFLARHILRIEPLASLDEDRVIELVAPALQHYLTARLR
ncbi:MAG: TetR/AcrR family transcriptional regulator [Deltaproteobacteria bacterium]|nr:MAG: TetR/AcrR family transcriptional regulator [Deltaproteobacteria bacterium]